MSDSEQMPSIYEICEKVFSQQKGKPPTLDEIRSRRDMIQKYLRIYEDEYYRTVDTRFGQAYEDLYERYVQLRDLYDGAERLLRGLLGEREE